MRKHIYQLRLLAITLLLILPITGCSFDRRYDEMKEQLFLMVNTERGLEIAKELRKHKAQIENTEIANQSADEDLIEQTKEPDEPEIKEIEHPEKTASEGSEFEERYYYTYLSDSMRTVYEEIYKSILSREEVAVSTLSTDLLDIAFQSVLNDYPEIFYVRGYHYTEVKLGDELTKIKFIADYDKTTEEVEEAQVKIDAYTKTCLSGITSDMDEYKKIKYIYDYLIINTEYDLNAPDNQNICSVFINQKSVCQGYAEATQYLLSKLGFHITTVAGDVKNGGRHAWNLIMVEGSYYYLDTTWGDVDYQSSEGIENEVDKSVMPINYDYFLITTEQLTKTHIIENVISLPACVAYENNYYRKEGLYFNSVDEEKLNLVFSDAVEMGKTSVTIKCSDEWVYEQMRIFLLEENEIFQYLGDKRTVTYYDNDEMQTLCFWLD